MPLRKDAEGVLLALTVESKLLLVGPTNRYGEKGICQINSCIPGTRVCAQAMKPHLERQELHLD